MSKKEINQDYEIGSGNVFEDLGFQDSEEQLAKAKLALIIKEFIESKNLTQLEAAQLLGIDQPKVSALTRGKLSGFSLERLIFFIMTLGCDVDLVIKDQPLQKSHPPHFQVLHQPLS